MGSILFPVARVQLLIESNGTNMLAIWRVVRVEVAWKQLFYWQFVQTQQIDITRTKSAPALAHDYYITHILLKISFGNLIRIYI